MILLLLTGTLLIAVTVVIHAVGTITMIPIIRRVVIHSIGQRSEASRVSYTIVVVLWLFLLHTVDVWLWAAAYLHLTELPDLETALYFSTVCFTTLGFGDVVLGPEWRLLSALQAANGILLFGWSTAFLFAVVRRIWEAELSASADV